MSKDITSEPTYASTFAGSAGRPEGTFAGRLEGTPSLDLVECIICNQTIRIKYNVKHVCPFRQTLSLKK